MVRSRLKFTLQQLGSRLWVKPLGYALTAVLMVLLARLADMLPFEDVFPEIGSPTVEKLLTVISSSMLAVSTFAVASMVQAYASASNSATPRAFVLVVSDGLSQTALSSFIGAFIFSVVGIIAIKVGYFGTGGRFALFVFTLMLFVWVILTFVRWVDNIARLGRMGNTIERVERATREAFANWTPGAPLGARPAVSLPAAGWPLVPEKLGFVQHVDAAKLQDWAEENDAEVHVQARPGSFVHPDAPFLTIRAATPPGKEDEKKLHAAIVVAENRDFGLDPRFGLIVMGEIASRALSPAVNDPGTAIDIVVRIARLLKGWSTARPETPDCPRVFVPELAAEELVEDAYSAIAKDGASSVELGIWLQKMLHLLEATGGPDMRRAARDQARIARDRAKVALDLDHDLDRLDRAAESLQLN